MGRVQEDRKRVRLRTRAEVSWTRPRPPYHRAGWHRTGLSRTYLEENLAALAVELTRLALAELDQALPPSAAAGMRYPEVSMKEVNR